MNKAWFVAMLPLGMVSWWGFEVQSFLFGIQVGGLIAALLVGRDE